MKHFLTYAASLLVVFAIALAGVVHQRNIKAAAEAKAAYTDQQKATHIVYLLDDDNEPNGLCTGTAVGPDVILTAEHCIRDGKDFTSTIKLDRSTHIYKVVGVGLDDRDHAILLLDTPAFTNIVTPDPVALKVGDDVYMWGSGGGKFPPRKLEGKVVDCEDPSDVDADQEQMCFSFAAIPGDSGSLIYSASNNLVAIVTYKSNNPKYATIGFKVEEGTFNFFPVEPKEKKKDDNPFKGLF